MHHAEGNLKITSQPSDGAKSNTFRTESFRIENFERLSEASWSPSTGSGPTVGWLIERY
jgi:hypothetical protein